MNIDLNERDKRIIAIVDGYSTGKYFAIKLNKLGYRCVHIQSSKSIPAVLFKSFVPENYLENLIYDGANLDFIIEKLNAMKVLHIIVGTETGVILTDLLTERLHLITNGTKYSEARRNKFKMIEVLKKHNLQTANHFKSDKQHEIILWAKELNSWPIVIKQLQAAASEKVYFCNSAYEISEAFNKILGTKDLFGNENKEVLAESFLDGPQYMVNVVSVKGKHFLSDLWENGKKFLPDGTMVHDHAKFLPTSSKLKDELFSYVKNVLDALEISNGPSHSEVFMTKNGPILVEIAARLMGPYNPDAVSQCIGHNHVDLTLSAYLDHEFFKNFSDSFQLKKHLLLKILISNRSGIIKKINGFDKIMKLPSYVSMNTEMEVNKFVEKTTNLFTSAGFVWLSHHDENVLQHDYETINALEKNMIEVMD